MAQNYSFDVNRTIRDMMAETWPKLTLVWLYEGYDVDDRRKTLSALDYPGVDIVTPDRNHPLDQLTNLMSRDAEVCMFWTDDGKPVGIDFLKAMVRPLKDDETFPALMHLWSGNAVAMKRSTLDAVQKGMFRLVGNSFMKLAIFFLEVGTESRSVRSHVVVSTTEQLVPLSAEPYGRVC